MKLTKSEAINKLGNLKEFERFSDDEEIYITFMKKASYKTNAQNSLFHSLLTCFWLSGCSSFVDYEAMRLHYKRIGGLVTYKYESSLTDWTKKCLWRAIKLLPLEDSQMEIVKNYLKGRVEVVNSWADVNKSNAKITLDILLKDMEESKIFQSTQAKKYEEILRGINQFWEDIK